MNNTEPEVLIEEAQLSKGQSIANTLKRVYTLPWNFMRAFYTLMGIVIIIQGFMRSEWFGVMFGTYFASMGLFSFGCASGSCFGGNCEVPKRD